MTTVYCNRPCLLERLQILFQWHGISGYTCPEMDTCAFRQRANVCWPPDLVIMTELTWMSVQLPPPPQSNATAVGRLDVPFRLVYVTLLIATASCKPRDTYSVFAALAGWGWAGQPPHKNTVHMNRSAVLLSHINKSATIRTSQPNRP